MSKICFSENDESDSRISHQRPNRDSHSKGTCGITHDPVASRFQERKMVET